MSGSSARWRALGTDVHVVVDEGDLATATAAVERVLGDVDSTYSRFRSDSEIALLNDAAGRAVRVSPLLARALDAALRGARVTGGLVDPTVGRAMRAIGYDVDFDVLRRRPSAATVRLEPVAGWQAIEFERATRTVRIPAGVELDLGSVGKALAADLAALEAGRALGGSAGVLVSLGGDVAMAGHAPDGGWRILAADSSATPAGSDGEVVALSSGAIATSSTTVRRWQRGGVTVHHIVDPRTGAPAGGRWRTASVVAASCVDANIAATAAILMGDDATAWLERQHLAARLVDQTGSVVRVAGWPMPARASRDDTAPSFTETAR